MLQTNACSELYKYRERKKRRKRKKRRERNKRSESKKLSERNNYVLWAEKVYVV